jgi:cold shock CspA family protein
MYGTKTAAHSSHTTRNQLISEGVVGTVLDVNEERGYGFIRPEMDETGGRDVFYHVGYCVRGTRRSPVKGDRVRFDLVKTLKGSGYGARSVELLEPRD